MKRFHVHLGVNDLDQSIRFYSNLFGAEPSVRRDDYAKWMLDDPRVNFAISHRGGKVGVNHLGLQVESGSELAAVRGQFAAADTAATIDDPGAACCYAKSDKHWVTDPQGIAWEAFHTLGSIPLFASEEAEGAAACSATVAPATTTAHGKEAAAKTACCAPATRGAGAPCCA